MIPVSDSFETASSEQVAHDLPSRSAVQPRGTFHCLGVSQDGRAVYAVRTTQELVSFDTRTGAELGRGRFELEEAHPSVLGVIRGARE